tara:strand:- start:296 stop:541 length:246 start_codon:yes stop_codon:yes gene_type:complete
MIKRFLNFILMAFKANNVRVKGKVKAPSKEGAISSPPLLELTQFETEILLNAMKNSTFSGDMISDLYILISKLETNHQNFK